MNSETQTKVDVYGIATSRILHHLNRGTIPWHVSWFNRGIPRNLVTDLEYRGLNVFLLSALRYPKNLFISPKHLDDMGGMVKKGEQPHPVFYWFWKRNDPNGDKKSNPVFRYSYVFNVSQCIGIRKTQLPKLEVPVNPFQTCIAIIANMRKGPAISHGLQPSCYMPTLDCIDLPKKETFGSDEEYFSSLFRSLIHSTGHESRLNRKEIMRSYVTEEGKYSVAEQLIGDVGAAQLAGIAGVQYISPYGDEHTIKWIESLLNDTHSIVYASDQAQKAVDYILNRPRQ